MRKITNIRLLILSVLLCLSLCISFVGCNKSEGNDEESVSGTAADSAADTEADAKDDTDNEKSKLNCEETGNGMEIDYRDFFEQNALGTEYPLNSNTQGIKIIGERNLVSNNQINLDWTCSGIEMVVNNLGGDITFKIIADSAPSYFRVWVDGKVQLSNDGTVYFLISSAQTKLTLTKIASGEHKITLMKVTGHTLSRTHLTSVTLNGTILADKKPAAKDLYIEFVGDSICCGWGTIGNHSSAYTDQDGTLAYPYLISKELDADFSVMALSGHSLTAPNYLDIAEGYLYCSPLRNQTEAGKYSFTRKADIVVINAGTNDVYNNVSSTDFKAAYLNFLATVRENNPDCKIVCVYNMMNDTHGDAIRAAVAEYGGEENGVYVWEAERTSGHPSTSMHAKYAQELLTFMSQKGIVSDS